MPYAWAPSLYMLMRHILHMRNKQNQEDNPTLHIKILYNTCNDFITKYFLFGTPFTSYWYYWNIPLTRSNEFSILLSSAGNVASELSSLTPRYIARDWMISPANVESSVWMVTFPLAFDLKQYTLLSRMPRNHTSMQPAFGPLSATSSSSPRMRLWFNQMAIRCGLSAT